MVGRTLTRHAVPITFGLKAAGWLNGVLDALDGIVLARNGLGCSVAAPPERLRQIAELADDHGIDWSAVWPSRDRRTPGLSPGAASCSVSSWRALESAVRRRFRPALERRRARAVGLGEGPIPPHRTPRRPDPRAQHRTASARSQRAEPGEPACPVPLQRRTASSHSVVFPIPASPSMTTALGHFGVESRNRSIAVSSRSRPKIPSTPPPLRREDPTVGGAGSCAQELAQRCMLAGGPATTNPRASRALPGTRGSAADHALLGCKRAGWVPADPTAPARCQEANSSRSSTLRKRWFTKTRSLPNL